MINDYSTYRVELIISLFSRIVDLVNFEYVLKELEHFEIAILNFRLGLLNIWSPLKPEGNIYLNLSRYEERQVAKMIVVLNYLEKGETLIDPYYRELHIHETAEGDDAVDAVEALQQKDAEQTDALDKGEKVVWQVPATWYAEESFPDHGVLSLQYFSGKGKGINNCEPNIQCRMQLMTLVLASPYEEDFKALKTELTLEHAEGLIQKAGMQLHFKHTKAE